MTEQEALGEARVVPRSFDSDCVAGICPHGCSHLMWRCARCGSEGGWGARDEVLRKFAAEHRCPPVVEAAPSDTDAREAWISLLLAEGHELDMQSTRNLGYYRTEADCECGAVLWWGQHDGDPTWRQVYGGHLVDVALAAGFSRSQPVQVEVTGPDHAADVKAWIDKTLALPMYQNVISEYGQGVVETLKAVRKLLDGGMHPDMRAALHASQPVQVEVTAEMVERAAKGIFDSRRYGESWDRARMSDNADRMNAVRGCRDEARAALKAALGVPEEAKPGTLAYAQARAEADGSLDGDEDGYDGPVPEEAEQ